MVEHSFETTLKECPVKIDGNDYVLRELSGLAKGKYLNKMGTKVVLGPEGQIQSFKDYTGLETILLEVSLFDANDKSVSNSVMQAWPSTTLGGLFELAQELSGLGEKSRKKLEDEAKNS